ncbi:MAG: hypothetical protein WAK57_02640 [Desulfobacterales bacterium]
MTNAKPDSETSEVPLWTFVPPADYRVPRDTIENSLRTRVTAFWRNLHQPDAAEARPPAEADQLEALPARLLDEFAPPDEWPGAVAGLEEALDAHADDRDDGTAIGIIGAPFSGHAQALAAVAARRRWARIPPPTTREIIFTPDDWIDRIRQTAARSPWVLLGLEKCFLRHPRGLQTVRLLLAELTAGRLGQGTVACGSWAWAYLEVAAGAGILPVLTPQAFQGERLWRWLARLAGPQATVGCSFRLGDSRKAFFPDPQTRADSGEQAAPPEDYLILLAACSRGIGGVARAMWRHSLRRMPPDADSDTRRNPDADAGDRRQVIRVLPKIAPLLPTVPAVERPAGDFVLHNLLLHDGQPEELLFELLPLPRFTIMQALDRLQSAGVAVQASGSWQVAPLAYPAVRRHLEERNFLTDPF